MMEEYQNEHTSSNFDDNNKHKAKTKKVKLDQEKNFIERGDYENKSFDIFQLSTKFS